jgi:hypothetical protein
VHAGSFRSAKLAAVACVVAIAMSACGGGARAFNAHGVTFAYPGGWEPIAALSVAPSPAGSPAASSRDAVGLDPTNAVILVITHVKVPVTEANLGQVQGTIVSAIAQGAQRSGGTVAQGPDPAHMGGLPGFDVRIQAVQVGGRAVSSRLIVAFDGATEYLLNCQAAADHASEMDRGCQQVIDSFSVA